jgi:hypothetical protein
MAIDYKINATLTMPILDRTRQNYLYKRAVAIKMLQPQGSRQMSHTEIVLEWF